MESPELVLCLKTERVVIYKIPPLSTSKGHYLQDWKESIWEGGIKVTQKNKVLKIQFIDKTEKLFAETVVPADYREAIVKTNDSSRGYALRLQNPKGGFQWIGVAFRDRNDSFDFGVIFQEHADRSKFDLDPNGLKKQFGDKIDFSLKKGEKVIVNIGGKPKKPAEKGLSEGSDFGVFDFSEKPKVAERKEQTSQDWLSDFSKPKQEAPKQATKQEYNLLDL